MTDINPYLLTDDSKLAILWETFQGKIKSIYKDESGEHEAQVELEDGEILYLCNADIEERK